MGYARAGFEVVGVDIVDQPRYPFEFHRADALEFPLEGFDAVHASPPCQSYSAMSTCRPGLAGTYAALIPQVRARLLTSDLPYIIENVPGAPLIEPTILCGFMFGLELYRHRLFETSFPLEAPAHPDHVLPASRAGHWEPGTVMSVAGHIAPIAHARKIMEIDWMTRAELGEAIPPPYTEHVGRWLIDHLYRREVA